MTDIMRPVQVRDLTATLFRLRLGRADDYTGTEIKTVTEIGDKKLAVTFADGTRAVLSVAVYRTQGTEGESDGHLS